MLIDDNGRAVLRDFGLSRVKADVTTHAGNASAAILVGSRNWMAPDRFTGRLLKKPCDIYAFGMIIYEVPVQVNLSQLLGF